MGVAEKLARRAAQVVVGTQLRMAEAGKGNLVPEDVRSAVRGHHAQRYARLVNSDLAPLPGADPATDNAIVQSLIKAAGKISY